MNVIAAGEENDGPRRLPLHERILERKSVDLSEPDIEKRAAWNQGIVVRQEVARSLAMAVSIVWSSSTTKTRGLVPCRTVIGSAPSQAEVKRGKSPRRRDCSQRRSA